MSQRDANGEACAADTCSDNSETTSGLSGSDGGGSGGGGGVGGGGGGRGVGGGSGGVSALPGKQCQFLLQVSAPGKVILFGEHSVLYGRPAVAVAVGLRTTLRLYSCPGWVSLQLPAIGLCRRWPLADLNSWLQPLTSWTLNNNGSSSSSSSGGPNSWQHPQLPSRQLRQQLAAIISRRVPGLSSQHTRALVSFFYLYTRLCAPAYCSGLHIQVESELPAGAGLGSSAAYGVALVTALVYGYCRHHHHEAAAAADEDNDLQLSTPPPSLSSSPSSSSPFLTCPTSQSVVNDDDDDDVEEDLAEELNVIKRGQAEVCPGATIRAIISGWALASDDIIHGQASGIDNAVCTHGGAIKFHAGQISPLEHTHLMQVLLVDTRVPRDTRQLVQHVRRQLDDPLLAPVLEQLLDSMQLVAESAVLALAAGDEQTVCRLVGINQGLLHALGVSHPALASVGVVAARNSLTAKLTGAGGGGFAVVPLPAATPTATVSSLKSELIKMGFDVYEVGVGGAGVTVHNMTHKIQ